MLSPFKTKEKKGALFFYECQMALIDFTLSNARRFYSSMGNPLGWKGLRGLMKLPGFDGKLASQPIHFEFQSASFGFP